MRIRRIRVRRWRPHGRTLVGSSLTTRMRQDYRSLAGGDMLDPEQTTRVWGTCCNLPDVGPPSKHERRRQIDDHRNLTLEPHLARLGMQRAMAQSLTALCLVLAGHHVKLPNP